MDRDIRLEAWEIRLLDDLCRKRIRELTKKIEAADERRLAGDTIQHGTLDAHHKEREALIHARGQFEGARKHFVHEINRSLGIEA